MNPQLNSQSTERSFQPASNEEKLISLYSFSSYVLKKPKNPLKILIFHAKENDKNTSQKSGFELKPLNMACNFTLHKER